MHVLSAGVPFYRIETILVENILLSTRDLDYFMGQRGFLKFHQLAIDAVYMQRKHLWLPRAWDSYWDMNVEFRKKIMKEKYRYLR